MAERLLASQILMKLDPLQSNCRLLHNMIPSLWRQALVTVLCMLAPGVFVSSCSCCQHFITSGHFLMLSQNMVSWQGLQTARKLDLRPEFEGSDPDTLMAGGG